MSLINRIERTLALERVFRLKIRGWYLFPQIIWYMMALSLVPVSIVLLFGLSINIPLLNISVGPDLVMFATWIIWWPMFFATVFFVSRAWCGICPWGWMVDIGNRVRRFFNKGPIKALNLKKWGFAGPFLFLLIGYLHDAGGFTNSRVMTFEFIAFFFLFAFVIGVWLPRRSFCRGFCFLGDLPGIFGRLSPLTLKVDSNVCFTQCKDKPCLIGTSKAGQCPTYIHIPAFDSNRHCLLCGNCIKNCPYDNIKVAFRRPAEEIEKGVDFSFFESIFPIAALAILGTFVAMETGILSKFASLAGIVNHWVASGSYALLALVASFSAYVAVSFVSSRIAGMKFKDALSKFGFMYLPFVYLAFVRDVIVTYAIQGSPLVKVISLSMINYLNVISIVFGAAWTIYIGYKIMKVFSTRNHFLALLPHTMFILLIGVYWFYLVPAVPLPSIF